MDIDVLYRPVNSVARVRLQTGERIVAEPSAMIGMSTSVSMTTGMRGAAQGNGDGLLGKIAGAAKSMLAGESFFTNTFTANSPGEVLLAPALSGDIIVEELPQRGITMQSGAYVANTPGVDIQAKIGGGVTFFGGEGMFVLQATPSAPGQKVVIASFGGIEEMQVDGSMVVDNGHLVAWDSGLDLSLHKAATGWIGSFLSDEGKVFHINGQGRVWIQTRQPIGFGRAIASLLPPRK